MNIFSSITNMLHGKGAKDLSKAITFLENYIKYSKEELRITDNNLRIKLFSSIGGLFSCQGIPNDDEINKIKEIITECKNINNDNYLNIYSSITSMLCGKGTKNLDNAKTFLDNFIEFAKNELQINNEKIFSLFSSTSGMFTIQGVPNNEEFNKIKEIITKCKNIDSENFVRFFQNISGKYHGKKVPDYIDLNIFIKNQYKEFKK